MRATATDDDPESVTRVTAELKTEDPDEGRAAGALKEFGVTLPPSPAGKAGEARVSERTSR